MKKLESLTIKRTIAGQEIEIELTWDEIFRAHELAMIKNNMEDIREILDFPDIPEDELLEYAREMQHYMMYYDYSWQGARDAVCEGNGLYEKYLRD